jgi:hypothetical protein
MQIARACILLLVIVLPALAKRNDDVVVMKNGDRLTGEIKRLQDGKLYFSAPYMVSEVALDWSQVERLESKDQFTVYLTGGQLHLGLIAKNSQAEQDDAPTFSIHTSDQDVQVRRRQVVSVRPVENSVLNQLTGSVDYGYSFTGGNNSTTQSQLAAAVAYRVGKWWMEVDGSSVLNTQSEGSSTGRNTFNLFYARRLADRWYGAILTELLNSRQQDLTLRSTTGAALGRVVLRSERSSLTLLGGLLYSREKYTSEAGEQPQANNAEALIQMRYRIYTFKRVGFDAVAYAYPSLTDQGRVRMGGQHSLNIELFRNFRWKFSLYENFDSRPPVNAPRNDFGTATSLGWTF